MARKKRKKIDPIKAGFAELRKGRKKPTLIMTPIRDPRTGELISTRKKAPEIRFEIFAGKFGRADKLTLTLPKPSAFHDFSFGRAFRRIKRRSKRRP